MVYCSIYAYTKGNPNLIYRGTDPNGNVCGIGATAEYPFVYFTDPASLTAAKRVCVTSCPVY